MCGWASFTPGGHQAWTIPISSGAPKLDLAVLQIQISGLPQPLPAIPLGDSTAAVAGQTNVLICGFGQAGSSFTHRVKLTKGVLSGRRQGRIVGSNQVHDGNWLTVDAEMLSGHSGGPLLDQHGSAIGWCVSSQMDGRTVAGVHDVRPIEEAYAAFAEALEAADPGRAGTTLADRLQGGVPGPSPDAAAVQAGAAAGSAAGAAAGAVAGAALAEQAQEAARQTTAEAMAHALAAQAQAHWHSAQQVAASAPRPFESCLSVTAGAHAVHPGRLCLMPPVGKSAPASMSAAASSSGAPASVLSGATAVILTLTIRGRLCDFDGLAFQTALATRLGLEAENINVVRKGGSRRVVTTSADAVDGILVDVDEEGFLRYVGSESSSDSSDSAAQRDEDYLNETIRRVLLRLSPP